MPRWRAPKHCIMCLSLPLGCRFFFFPAEDGIRDGRVTGVQTSALPIYGPETRPLAERCIISYSRSAGPVMQNSLYNNNYQIVQSPGAVIIDVEMNHDARIIPIVKSKADVKHRPGAIRPWFGDSVGWYEGDTLVVETVNVNPKQNTAQISATGVLTERFTRWSASEILYEFSVDDPALYTQVWKGEQSLHASKEPLYEYACHEGNYALTGILAGARVQ